MTRGIAIAGRRAALVVVCCLVTACSFPRVPVGDDSERLAEAERSFAAAARTSGVKAAFVATLGADATLFRPGPVNGRDFMRAQAEAPYALDWQPQRVAAARSGDLGYSTGPYRLTANARPDAPAYGQFMTVWKRGLLDRWEVLFDHGIAHAGAIGWGPLSVIVPDGGPTPSRSIVAAEAEFARRSADEGLAAAYRATASTHLRLLRDGVAPIERLQDLPDGDARWTWNPSENGVSNAGDLAWVTGRYRADATAGGSHGYYVRVWRAERGDWKVLADVLAPVADAAHRTDNDDRRKTP